MSWPMLLAPRRLARLFAADVMNVTRDPMLAFATALSLMPSLALHFFGEAMDAAAQRAMGIETISAGTPARASPIRLPAPNELQISGGEGHTSNTASGFSASPARPPARRRSAPHGPAAPCPRACHPAVWRAW